MYCRVLVFPEGTCTNGRALLTFRRGAFTSGRPVQPVAILYPGTSSVTWTTDSGSMVWVVARLLATPHTPATATFLPVVAPSPRARCDPHPPQAISR